MYAALRTWLIALTVLFVTLAPIFIARNVSEHILAFGILFIDALCVMAARFGYRRLETAASKSSLNLSQSLVLAAGTGFGISAVLICGYLAYLFDL
ncbi:hypothetical protein ELE36_17605 [Pseudolysobacter antarcticus]|uniref:Uncharacterized protein n=1 Tax=Pseudolysobacter antarcticus TaxID=2511995 RepID=A0A411HNH3_9GAMM|nr:hypothetical protein [Pseudolysobacter antarcticus]QBB72033.1 hypothetical protein ELE36_17605 [Pseudolysobacter antarcticus]